MGNNALDLGRNTQSNKISKCEFENIGRSGVQIGEFSI
jgi:hypothetical protein